VFPGDLVEPIYAELAFVTVGANVLVTSQLRSSVSQSFFPWTFMLLGWCSLAASGEGPPAV
jgi:hypothetical protein